MQKPLFIHERDAHEPLIEILSKYSKSLPPIVIHCFTGNKKEAEKYIELGFYIGITGNFTHTHILHLITMTVFY